MFLKIMISMLLLAPAMALAENCTERDYRGLEISQAYAPIYQELLCQLKVMIKNRTNHDSLRMFTAIGEPYTGIGPKDLNWDQPLVKVINDIINQAARDGKTHNLVVAAQKFFVQGGTYNLPAEEIQLIDVLLKIEPQNGGKRL